MFLFQFCLLAEQMELGGKSALNSFQLFGEASHAPLPLICRPVYPQLLCCSQHGRIQLPGRGKKAPSVSAAGYGLDSAHKLLAPEITPQAISFPAVCLSLSGMWKLHFGVGQVLCFVKPGQSQRGTGFPCLITGCS